MTALSDGPETPVVRAPLDADRIKHLEFIQAVITRMGTNSFLVKGWALTLAAAFLALSMRPTELAARPRRSCATDLFLVTGRLLPPPGAVVPASVRGRPPPGEHGRGPVDEHRALHGTGFVETRSLFQHTAVVLRRSARGGPRGRRYRRVATATPAVLEFKVTFSGIPRRSGRPGRPAPRRPRTRRPSAARCGPSHPRSTGVRGVCGSGRRSARQRSRRS